jgi:ketosteroid isomerase-like protein
MTVADDLDQVIEEYRQALGEFMKGDPEPVWKLHSHREDVTLANPRGGIAHGWEQVAKRMEDVASGRREGEMSFEIVEKFVTPELACVVQMERAKAKFGASEDVTSYALRATIIFRREDGTWKVAHRHADPLSSVQQAATYEVE